MRTFHYPRHVSENASFTLDDLATRLIETVSEETRWRLLLAFLDEYRYGDPLTRCDRFIDEPRHVGDARWDAMLAAVAEHLAYHSDTPAPKWVRAAGREWIGAIWWVNPLPSARPWALAHSPAAFRRRGIFLHPDDIAVA